jgi:hypothetical protein
MAAGSGAEDNNNRSEKTDKASHPSLEASRNHHPNFSGAEKVTADFQCFVCGAVFTTDEDRKQHLEKEVHGQLHEELSSKKEIEIAKRQKELNESREHIV